MPRHHLFIIAIAMITFFQSTNHSQHMFQQRLFDACWSGNLDSLKAIPLAKAVRSGAAYGGGPVKPPAGADVQWADEDGLAAMHIAAFRGNVEVMQYLLENGADPDVSTKSDLTPLHLAVQGGHIPAVEFLISKKVNSRRRTSDGLTPFFLAIQSGHKGMIDFLIDMQKAGRIKRDWDTKDKSDNTLLHYAAATGNLDLLRRVLGEFDDVNTKNATGNTPLHIAAVLGDERMTSALLERKADINATNNGDAAPIHLAVREGHDAVVRLLLQHNARIDRPTMLKKTPLRFAAEKGNEGLFSILEKHNPEVLKDDESILLGAVTGGSSDIVQKCINAGNDVNIRDRNDTPLLIRAIITDSTEVILTLISKGARTDVKDQSGRTPLHYASMTGNLRVLQAVLEKGAKVTAEDERDFTPLHLACLYGHTDIARVLLAGGADVNAQTSTKGSLLGDILKGAVQTLILRQGTEAISLERRIESATNEARLTPLHMAVMGGIDELVSLLIERGADPRRITAWGNSVLHLAASRGHTQLLRNLLPLTQEDVYRENDNNQTVFDILFHAGRMDELRELLHTVVENPILLQASVEKKSPVLHFACFLGETQLVGRFLDGGSDINRVHKMTPLQFSLLGGQGATSSLLLEKNADPSKKSSNGSTALHAAATRGNPELTRMIADRYADGLERTNDDGQTPLMLAVGSGDVETVQLLLTKGANHSKRDDQNNGVLHYATMSGSLDMVRLIVEGSYSPDVNAATKEGITALHVAAAGGGLEIVQYLLAKGASANAVTRDSLTPLHLAAAGGHTRVVGTLLQSGATQGRASVTMWEKTLGGAIRAAKPWGTAGIFVMMGHLFAEDKSHGWMPVHFAAREGQAETVQFLLANGASASSLTSDRITPLHLACKSGDMKTIKALLTDGSATGSIKPLLAEIASNYQCYGSAVRYTIGTSCNINATDRNGWTPLHWANFFENTEVTLYLAANGANENAATTRELKVTETIVIPVGLEPRQLYGMLGQARANAILADQFRLGEKQYTLWR